MVSSKETWGLLLKAALGSVQFWVKLAGTILLYFGLIWGMDRIAFLKSLNLPENTLHFLLFIAIIIVVFWAAHDVLKAVLIQAKGNFYRNSRQARLERGHLIFYNLHATGLQWPHWNAEQKRNWIQSIFNAIHEYCEDNARHCFLLEEKMQGRTAIPDLTDDEYKQLMDQLNVFVEGTYKFYL